MSISPVRIIIGYAISDPVGHYPSTPEYGIGCWHEVQAEAGALNHDFAADIGEGAFTVKTLFDDGTAEMIS